MNDIEATSISHLNFCESKSPNTFIKNKVSKDEVAIVVVRSGRAELVIDSKRYPIRGVSFVFVHSEIKVSFENTSDDFLVYSFVFSLQVFHEVTRLFELWFVKLFFIRRYWIIPQTKVKVLDSYTEIVRYLVAQGNRPMNYEMIVSLLTLFIYETYHEITKYKLSRSTIDVYQRPTQLFKYFMEILLQRYKKEHEVKYYAKELCIGPKYLTQITRKAINKTPKEIIDDRLFCEAMRQLSSTNNSIQEISLDLGFLNQSYFGRFFKKMSGISPNRYRSNPSSIVPQPEQN